MFVSFNGQNDSLQWGHGIAAVESGMLSTFTPSGDKLQWGHGIAAVESLVFAVEHFLWHILLQWGHGIAAVESILSQHPRN